MTTTPTLTAERIAAKMVNYVMQKGKSGTDVGMDQPHLRAKPERAASDAAPVPAMKFMEDAMPKKVDKRLSSPWGNGHDAILGPVYWGRDHVIFDERRKPSPPSAEASPAAVVGEIDGMAWYLKSATGGKYGMEIIEGMIAGGYILKQGRPMVDKERLAKWLEGWRVKYVGQLTSAQQLPEFSEWLTNDLLQALPEIGRPMPTREEMAQALSDNDYPPGEKPLTRHFTGADAIQALLLGK